MKNLYVIQMTEEEGVTETLVILETLKKLS